MRHRGGDDRTRGHHNRRRRSGDQSGPCRQRAERAESRPGIGRHFAVRTGHYRAKVHIQTGDSPVIICLGPGFTFESTAAEAGQLALDLAGALAQLQNGPRTSSRPSWTPSSRSTKQATADHMTSAARRKLLTGRQEAVGDSCAAPPNPTRDGKQNKWRGRTTAEVTTDAQAAVRSRHAAERPALSRSAELLIREWIRGQGIRSEPVRTGAFGDVPDQENDGADQRDKADQNPPARAVNIMQAPNGDGNAGN